MTEQPTQPPWPVTGAFECRACRMFYRSALAARNCCAKRRSPGPAWDCGQEHPQGRLHLTERDARECIERNRKAESDA